MDFDRHGGQARGEGLAFDLGTIVRRRRALGLLGLAGLGGALAGCELFGPAHGREADKTANAADGTACIKDPAETEGPFPADGTNSKSGATLNMLTQSGVRRADIRQSFAGMSPLAQGAPIELTLRLADTGAACAPMAGRAVYVWHCDRDGKYSLYDLPDRNYLRGIGIADSAGEVRFTSVFPGCYPGRWPHVHFEVFADIGHAASGKASLLTSQLAMPGDVATALYGADAGYRDAAANLKRLTAATDGVFAASTPRQLAAQTPKVTGDAATGFKAYALIGL